MQKTFQREEPPMPIELPASLPPRGPHPRSGVSLPPWPVLVAAAVALFAAWVWFGWRIEPGNGSVAVLMRKTGKELPQGEILAPGPGWKGIQLDVLPEGRYFRNPWTWHWSIVRAVDIPAGKFGVLVRKYGKDLPEGEIIAPDAEHRGIVREVLGTGKHRINPYAYEVRLFDDITIKPGNVGVVTSLCGSDILSGGTPETEAEGFLVRPGSKGVLAGVLKEGTHRLNPFLYAVSIVNIQSQRFELSGADAISFLTLDGFTVSAEGTLEFNIDADHAALLTQEVGDMDDILQKIILPSARGFSRLEGSKKSATEFIVGVSRQAFQDSLEAYLKSICEPWGISLNSVLIRDIFAPQTIAGIIRDRELAVQEGLKIDQQIVQARSQAELEKQKALADRNSAVVAAETERIQQTIAASQKQAEETIAAEAALEVAKAGLKAAEADAAAQLARAEAERAVVEKRTTAGAEVLRQEVAVYRDEADYVRARLYAKIAPNLEEVLTADRPGELFGLPFRGAAKGE
jgi:regulator of protease activity HflC (stomatin/prohibitin superfamily)